MCYDGVELDLADEVINPEEPWSFAHIMNTIALVTLLYGVGKLGKPGEGKSGGSSSIKITNNIGREIDITPSNHHTSVFKNPGPRGTPNSSVDILDEAGNIVTRRWYDSNGKAYRDVDMTNHRNSKTHPEYPHEHFWNWTDETPKRSN